MSKQNWIENARNLLIEQAINEIFPFQNYFELERNVKHVIISYGLLFAAQKEGIFKFIRNFHPSKQYPSPNEIENCLLSKLKDFFSTYIK
ncbi:MAG: hypothetical protein R6U96_17440 [Promethearchaeia archaeon]